jgi:uncharacterized repeat protein (TIGR01451 family)
LKNIPFPRIFFTKKETFHENHVSNHAERGTRNAERGTRNAERGTLERKRLALGLTAAVFGAALYLGAAGDARAQSTFAAACAGQPAGTSVSIGPFVTGISTWTVDPGSPTPGYRLQQSDYAWINPATPALGQPAGASWIGMPGGTGSTGNTYTLTPPIVVDAGIIDLTSIQVNGVYSSDDDVTKVQIGANSTTGLWLAPWAGTNPEVAQLKDIASTFNTPALGSLFQAGNNTIAFTVNNYDNSPTGFYANFSISATCSQHATVAIAKTANTTAPLAPSDPVQYTLTVTNTSTTTPATNVTVTDPVPTGIDPASVSWTCAGAACPHASGTGALNETIATLPAGGAVTYTISANAVAAAVPPRVVNTAHVTGTDMVCDDGETKPCTAEVSNPFAEADMEATITGSSSTTSSLVTFTTICTNHGPDAAANATCDIAGVPPGATTTCTPTVPAGSLASGSSITCTTTFTPASTTPITVTATADSDTPDPDHTNNTAKTTLIPHRDYTNSGSATGVPTLRETALALLALLLAGGAALRMRRGR